MSRMEFNQLPDRELVAMLEPHYTGRHLEARGLDLRGRVFDGAHLHFSQFIDCSFDGASLRQVDLSSSHELSCSFVGAELTGADLHKAHLQKCDLRNARLVEGNLLRLTGWDLDLRGADLSRAKLVKCFLTDCDLRDAILRDAELRLVSMRGCYVAGADFRGAHGALLNSQINVGTPEEPHVLEGEEARSWLAAAGADVTEFVPESD